MSVTASTLVQTSAEVITILTLRENDVYKRFAKRSYSEQHDLKYGIVTSINYNGTEAMIVALEYDPLSGTTPEMVVWGTGSELKLFAAKPEEVIHSFEGLRERAEAAVTKAQTELESKLETLSRLERVIDTQKLGQLTAPQVFIKDTIQGSIEEAE